MGMEKWGQMRRKWGTVQGRGKEHLKRKETWLILRAPCINKNYIRWQRRSAVNKLALASRLWCICKWKCAFIRKWSSWEVSVPGKEILQKKPPFYYYMHGNKTLKVPKSAWQTLGKNTGHVKNHQMYAEKILSHGMNVTLIQQRSVQIVIFQVTTHSICNTAPFNCAQVPVHK